MYLFELMQKKNFEKLSTDQQTFYSKMITKEVERVAKEKNMKPEEVYYWFSKGLYGGDREI